MHAARSDVVLEAQRPGRATTTDFAGRFRFDIDQWAYLPLETPRVRRIKVLGFRGRSSGARSEFELSETDATPGYLAGSLVHSDGRRSPGQLAQAAAVAGDVVARATVGASGRHLLSWMARDRSARFVRAEVRRTRRGTGLPRPMVALNPVWLRPGMDVAGQWR